jgi:hypothetical protein
MISHDIYGSMSKIRGVGLCMLPSRVSKGINFTERSQSDNLPLDSFTESLLDRCWLAQQSNSSRS